MRFDGFLKLYESSEDNKDDDESANRLPSLDGVKTLERDELLILRPSLDDRRKRYVELTRKGKALLQRARHSWRRAESRFENIFGKKPAAELRAVLLNIANNRELNSQPMR